MTRTVAITGTTRGIGQAIAWRFQQGGWDVLGVNRDTVDLANMRHVLRWYPDRELDVFINNAGVFPLVDYERTTYDQWEYILGINLRAPFFLTQRAVKKLKPGGCIVNIASVSGIQPDAEEIAYSISKAGLIMLSRCLARRYAGIYRVITISPGFVRTNLVPGDLPEELLRTIPVRREASPEEVAAVVWDAVHWPYANGIHIVLDGGLLSAQGVI